MFNDGTKYIGTWKNDLQNGYGKLVEVDGITQSGLWKDGFLVNQKSLEGCMNGNCDNGYGIYWVANEKIIVGVYQDKTLKRLSKSENIPIF